MSASDGSKESQDLLKELRDKIVGGFFKGLSGGVSGDRRKANGFLEAAVSGVVFFVIYNTVGRLLRWLPFPDKNQRALKRAGDKALEAVKRDGPGFGDRELVFAKDLDPQTAKILNDLLKREGTMSAYKPQINSGDSKSKTVEDRGFIKGRNVRGYYEDLNGDVFKRIGDKQRVTVFCNASKRDIFERCLALAQTMRQRQILDNLQKDFAAKRLDNLKYEERKQSYELEEALNTPPDKEADKPGPDGKIDTVRNEKEKKRREDAVLHGKKENFVKILEKFGRTIPKKGKGKASMLRDNQICHSYVTCTDFVKNLKNDIDMKKVDIRYNYETGLVEMSYAASELESVKNILKENNVKSEFTVSRPNSNLDNMRLNQGVSITLTEENSKDFDEFIKTAEKHGLDVVALPGQNENEVQIFLNEEQFNERGAGCGKDFEEYFNDLNRAELDKTVEQEDPTKTNSKDSLEVGKSSPGGHDERELDD